MSRQITHEQDDNGNLKQIVTPEQLRAILDADGDNYTRPSDFGANDEWDVADYGEV